MSVKSIAKKAFKANAITEEEYKQLLCVIRFYYRSLKPQGNMSSRVVYLCDGNKCPEEKASCKHGGPCRHTADIEHAINFRRFPDTDDFYEVENVMRIEDQENNNEHMDL